METQTRQSRICEDWLSVYIGLFIFAVSLLRFAGVDIFGWAVSTKVWTQPSQILAPLSKGYAGLPGLVSLVLTYMFMLIVMNIPVERGL